MTHSIFKLCSRAEWNAAVQAGVYVGSADDRRDGFIHFSLAHQVSATARKYFANVDDLVLVEVNATLLGEALRMEPSRGGDLFPHLYGPLSLDAVVAISDYAVAATT